MPELAKAYVQIIPSAEGIKGKLGEVMDGEADSAGRSAGGKFGSVFGSVAKAGLAAVGAGMAAAASAAVAMAKSAVEGFADYQQLTGGIETLFGEDQQRVMDAAAAAFKTAGLSANEYMETAIQSGAAMISSLDGDTAKAAELMDLSITDMADNVNKMGTTMEAVQNAYKGFSRNNFTMLDNLALGFAGTKEGMQELLNKAQEISGIEYDISSYSDIVQAIHVVQEEMGITGTTAKEAGDTITGSFGALKSAWQNLVVGMADPNADLSGLIGNVVGSTETAFANLMPVAEQALFGVASFVEQIAPVISEKLPGLVEALLPPILSAGSSLLTAVVAALPSLLGVLMEQGPLIINQLLDTVLTMLPEIVSLGLTLIVTLANGLADSIPTLIPTVVDVVLQIVDTLTKPETLGNLIDAALLIMMALAEGLIKALPELLEQAPVIIENLANAIIQNLPKVMGVAWNLLKSLAKGIAENLPILLESAAEIVFKILEGIALSLEQVVRKGAEIVNSVKSGFDEKVQDAKNWGKDMIQNFVDGIKEKWNALKTTVSGVASGIKSFLGFSEPEEGPLSDFHTYAPDMMALFAKGIRDNEHLITDQIGKSFDLSGAMTDSFTDDAALLERYAYRPERAKSAGTGGSTGGYTVEELAEAILLALQGCGIYLDGDAVGKLVRRTQVNMARVNG